MQPPPASGCETPPDELDYHSAFAHIYEDLRLASCTPEEDVRAATQALELRTGAHVLDWGCGTGIHARVLARAGYRVTAVDRSPAMLAIAESCPSTGAEVRYVLDDVAAHSTTLERCTFDAFCSFGNVLNCLADIHTMTKALLSLAGLLRVQGTAFIDVWNIAPLLCHGTRDTVREFTCAGRRYVQAMSAQLDTPSQVLKIDYRAFVAPQTAEMWRLITSRHRLCILTLDQYTHLFEAAGFQVKRVTQQRPRSNEPGSENDRLVSFTLQRN